MAETIVKFLAKSGLETRAVFDAQTAITYTDENTPDLIILELAMGEHNGAAFLQELRTYTDWVDIPIIIYSRVPKEDTGLTESQWQKLGVAGYYYKPTITLDQLARAIRMILSDHEDS